MNIAVPAEGEPTLLSYDQVETLFHEFGHGLHGLLTQQRYSRFSGTNGTPRDFIEFPSQFMEHYVAQPEVLAVYAKHAETGEVIPQALVDKILAASTHNQGFADIGRGYFDKGQKKQGHHQVFDGPGHNCRRPREKYPDQERTI